MVGIRVFLISITLFFLSSASIYAVLPSSKEKVDIFGEKETIEEITEETAKKETEALKRKKEEISESIIPLREERKRQLQPYVVRTESPLDEQDIFKIKQTQDKKLTPEPVKKIASKEQKAILDERCPNPLINLLFFIAIAAAFFGIHHLTKPKK